MTWAAIKQTSSAQSRIRAQRCPFKSCQSEPEHREGMFWGLNKTRCLCFLHIETNGASWVREVSLTLINNDAHRTGHVFVWMCYLQRSLSLSLSAPQSPYLLVFCSLLLSPYPWQTFPSPPPPPQPCLTSVTHAHLGLFHSSSCTSSSGSTASTLH